MASKTLPDPRQSDKEGFWASSLGEAKEVVASLAHHFVFLIVRALENPKGEQIKVFTR